jgi:hemerythrin-like metal-binding protein
MAQGLQQVVQRFRLKVEWNASMATGEAHVDEQHQVLVSQLNQLAEAMARGQMGAELENTLNFLEDYVTRHFQYEEGCMERHRCPAAAKNKTAHAKFVETFMALRARVRHGGGNSAALAVEVQRDLLDRLINHIRKIDTQLGVCISKRPTLG